MRLYFFFGLAIAAAACGGDFVGVSGGDDAGDATARDGASGDGSIGMTDGAATDGAATDASGDAARDASRDGGVDGGGSNPGHVACGSMTCDLGAGQACCDTVSMDASTHACGSLANLSFCMMGATQACDEKADCTNGNLCCILFNQNGIEARCLPTCITGAERYQACKTSAECENLGTCSVYSGCTAGESVQTCEKPRQCP